jgi:hypothetical protein
MRQVGRNHHHLAGAHDDFLLNALGVEPEVKRTAQDVGELLVVVAVPGDFFSLLEIHVCNHHALAGYQLAAQPLLELLRGHGVPAVMRDQ